MINYKLLTPGPLTTTASVKQAMLTDHCTWDDDYKRITQQIRRQLLELADVHEPDYTAVLMQGSGSFGVESVLTSVFGKDDKPLVLTNGAYGERIVEILDYAATPYQQYAVDYAQTFDISAVENYLQNDSSISHIVVVHCETTTGMLNDIAALGQLAKRYEKTFIVDAMSSFGGINIPMRDWSIDFLISSANKCIQGVPGFSFILANTEKLKATKGLAKSLSLDLYAQWAQMHQDGKWRFTSPTHVVLAFAQALEELKAEGGIEARYQRYRDNNQLMRDELAKIGIDSYIAAEWQSPFITTFLYPQGNFSFAEMYQYIKDRGYAIYPGKLTEIDTFRLGNIGEIHEDDVYRVTQLIGDYMQQKQ